MQQSAGRRWWKFLAVAVALCIVVVLTLRLAQPTLARIIMSRVLDSTLGTNQIDRLPDGLHVGLCGAGGPLADSRRSGPCVAVIAGKRLFVVDVGSNSARVLGLMGLRHGDVEAVFLTHFHSDHIDGLGELATLRWAGGTRTRPLPVHGPEPVSTVVAGLNQAYTPDHGFRVTHHGAAVVPPSGAGLIARPHPLPEDGQLTLVFQENDLEVSMFAVDHGPVKPAVGYLFRYRGRSAAISGDTSKSDNLIRMAKGAELLLHDALDPELVGLIRASAVKSNNASLAKITEDVLNYHATPEEAASTAQAVGARHLLLYHLVPPLPLSGLESIFRQGMAANYPGEITLGVDGILFSLPTGSEAIEQIAPGL